MTPQQEKKKNKVPAENKREKLFKKGQKLRGYEGNLGTESLATKLTNRFLTLC